MKRLGLWNLLLLLVLAGTSHAQLNKTFENIFNRVLRDDLRLSPGQHGTHFFQAADQANAALAPALNSLIASNVSSFPLSSTVAGVTFDFSSGQPMSIAESLGPIFAEKAQTLGKGKLNIGFNFTNLNLARLRGMKTEDIRFTFAHQDLTGEGELGENPTENDVIDLFLNLDANANIFAFYGTWGVTNNFDVSVAVPVVNVSMNGTARAVINSFTFARLGRAFHSFNADQLNPDLVDDIPYDESVTGLGDVALRLKYGVAAGGQVDMAALADIRFATGEETDFLGTGKTNARFSWIMSKKVGNFVPHLNLGYDYRGADLDSDEFEFVLGFDNKIAKGVTFAADLLAELDINSDESIELAPGSRMILDRFVTTAGDTAISARDVDLSNISNRDNDNTLDLALGFRIAPSENMLFLANILVPLNDGGLRSTFAPTFGFAISF